MRHRLDGCSFQSAHQHECGPAFLENVQISQETPSGQKSQPANKVFENWDLGAAIDGDVGRPEHA